MAEKTFTHELVFKKKAFDKENPAERKLEDVTKLVTFNELNQMERSQHKFHGKLFAFFATQSFADDGEKVTLDTDGIYDLTTLFIKNFLVTDEQFGIKERELLLNDSTALFDLGIWLMKEKFTPFFVQSRTLSKT